MWNKFIITVAALGLLLSCGGGGGPEDAAIAFSQNPLIVDSEAGVVDCGLICNASWTASCKEGWVTLLTEAGKAGDALKVRISSNPDEAERNATITVKAGSAGKVLQLVQSGFAGSRFVSSTKVSIDTYGTGTYIDINTEGEWTYTTPAEPWITLVRKGPAALGISAEINYTGQARSSSFTVSAADGSQSAEVTVTQQFSNERFLASTEYGRKLIYRIGSYIKSVTSDSYTVLTDGVGCFEMKCTLMDGFGGDSEAKKRSVFLFEVDMTKATVLATLPNDDNAKLKTVQKMTEQITALQNKRTNLNVWGGTNGDFFHGDDGTNSLQGVMWRGGTCLNSTFETTVNTVFAVFKDGSAKCMGQSEYASRTSDIQEAIGGRQVLVRSGGVMSFNDTSQEPRTAVGTSADGKTVWMLVVDGRDELYSTGSFSVSYEVMARLMKAAGAADAINLDGGGSSSFVVRGSGGTFSLHNKPSNSGRLERKVANGLAIVTSK